MELIFVEPQYLEGDEWKNKNEKPFAFVKAATAIRFAKTLQFSLSQNERLVVKDVTDKIIRIVEAKNAEKKS